MYTCVRSSCCTPQIYTFSCKKISRKIMSKKADFTPEHPVENSACLKLLFHLCDTLSREFSHTMLYFWLTELRKLWSLWSFLHNIVNLIQGRHATMLKEFIWGKLNGITFGLVGQRRICLELNSALLDMGRGTGATNIFLTYSNLPQWKKILVMLQKPVN